MSRPTFASVHLVGLGGTGTNIIQSLIESERLLRLLSSEDFGIACLAIDVAEADLASLQAAYKRTVSKLEAKGVSVDRLWVRGLNMKFNTPESLFEFMNKFNTYLLKDGIVVNNYKPWIQSTMTIPPLAGGVGRMRALSKAVYNLNYYHYSEMNSAISVFKDKVLTSKNQPIVVMNFGLGGGTGSGMVFDFARHLRAKLGSSVPLVGLVILPSSADDLLARGPAPYTALMEADLMSNRALNEKAAKKYGAAYQNPFTALFFLPLDPVYNNRNSLVTAKKELDDAVIDILGMLMRFDLADLLSRVGTNNDFGPNWAHTVAYLRIRYPVQDYIDYMHEYLKLLESIGSFMAEKRKALDAINGALLNRFTELKELYRRHLIATNSYRPDSFDSEVEEIIRRAGKYEAEFKRQVRGLEDFASSYNQRWSKVLKAMSFPEDSSEYGIVQVLNQWNEHVSNLGASYGQFLKDLPSYTSELENMITASKFLTSSHIRQVRSYTGFVNLVATALETLNVYIRGKNLAEEIGPIYSKDASRQGKNAAAKGEADLLPLFKAAGYILTRPETEVKVSDQYVPGIRLVKKGLDDNFKDASAELESTERLLAQKEAEVTRLTKELKKIRLDVSGKRKLLNRSLEALQNEAAATKAQLEQQRSDREKTRADLEKLTELEKGLEMTSHYRKTLASVVAKSNELNALMSAVTTTDNYYERVVELGGAEQLKIMEKILREEEESLRGESILKEIVDKERFRGIVKSYIRIFSVPNYAGLSDTYRTDLIWATVGIPPGLWDQELQGALSSVLNVYSSVEASKSISIRQIPQVDPWTVTFLIVMAKARIDQIEKFPSMKNDMDAVMKSEKVLFRSFLLEQGVQSVEELAQQLEGRRAGSQVEERKA
ncbi:MAG TPA: tubulin-like doman-containing protein [Nitrososphaerales archaeon]|nr:tubulin-like doman-containing protein [Nitrososphaerales archaeon]